MWLLNSLVGCSDPFSFKDTSTSRLVTFASTPTSLNEKALLFAQDLSQFEAKLDDTTSTGSF